MQIIIAFIIIFNLFHLFLKLAFTVEIIKCHDKDGNFKSWPFLIFNRVLITYGDKITDIIRVRYS